MINMIQKSDRGRFDSRGGDHAPRAFLTGSTGFTGFTGFQEPQLHVIATPTL
jgi:hypothetical protein